VKIKLDENIPVSVVRVLATYVEFLGLLRWSQRFVEGLAFCSEWWRTKKTKRPNLRFFADYAAKKWPFRRGSKKESDKAIVSRRANALTIKLTVVPVE
jgi:hypothetical protein